MTGHEQPSCRKNVKTLTKSVYARKEMNMDSSVGQWQRPNENFQIYSNICHTLVLMVISSDLCQSKRVEGLCCFWGLGTLVHVGPKIFGGLRPLYRGFKALCRNSCYRPTHRIRVSSGPLDVLIGAYPYWAWEVCDWWWMLSFFQFWRQKILGGTKIWTKFSGGLNLFVTMTNFPRLIYPSPAD